MYFGLGQSPDEQPVYRFLLPRQWRPDAPQTAGEPTIDSGASYPGCSPDLGDAAGLPGSPCRPLSFTSLQEGESYAYAHGEIPVIVSTEAEAWAVVERGTLGGSSDEVSIGETAYGTAVIGYPPGAYAPFTGGVCEDGDTLVGTGSGAYCVPQPQTPGLTVAPSPAGEPTGPATSSPSVAPGGGVTTVSYGGGGSTAPEAVMDDEEGGDVTMAGFGGDAGWVGLAVIGVFLLGAWREDRHERR